MNLKSHDEGVEMEIEDFPNTLLEIPLDIKENENYVLLCTNKDDNSTEPPQLYSLAHSSTSALTSQSFEFHFSDSDPILIWTASNKSTMDWLSVFDNVITVANERDLLLKQRLSSMRVNEYIETQNV